MNPLPLWLYCINNGWIDSDPHNPGRTLRHPKLDIMIEREYIWNYNIIFNITNKQTFRIKIIEYSLDIELQIQLLQMFEKAYGLPLHPLHAMPLRKTDRIIAVA